MYGIKKQKINLHLFDPIQSVEDFEIFKANVSQMPLELLEAWRSTFRIFNSNIIFDRRVMPETMNTVGRRDELLKVIENAIGVMKTIKY